MKEVGKGGEGGEERRGEKRRGEGGEGGEGEEGGEERREGVIKCKIVLNLLIEVGGAQEWRHYASHYLVFLDSCQYPVLDLLS